jgi:hypothetical protein
VSAITDRSVVDAGDNREAVESDGLARAFWRFGWIGFWAQVTIGALPVALTIYAWIVGRNPATGTRAGLALIDYLAIASLLVLAFTTFWSFRYTRLAGQLADPARGAPAHVLQRAAWIGVAASTVGILFSILVMLFEIGQLFLYFLRAPQAGVPVVQTTAAGRASWVSAADFLTLLALNSSLLIELLVLALSLRLLFRSMTASTAFADTLHVA